MRKNIILLLACVTLTGCGIYNKYEQKTEVPDDIFGNISGNIATDDSTSLAQLTWREFFTDSVLQRHIEIALANNTDLSTARINIEKGQAALKAAKLAYLPSVFFSPQGSLSSFGSTTAKTYNFPLQLSMDLDLFGSITNKKRAANAALMQAQMSEEMTRANLICSVAQLYIHLQLLDRELDILNETDSLWAASLDIQRALWENGKVYSTAVNQQEASWLDVKTQIVDMRRSIRSVENSLCRLLAITPQKIQRSRWYSADKHHSTYEGQHMFDVKFLKVGLPALMLEQRPDIRLANYYMEEAFYNTQVARASFFPNITLSGIAGWTNNYGVVVDPGKLLFSAVASLTQPLFARGQIKANYKIAQLTEESLKKKYVQTVIDAGNEVNECMADYMAAREKNNYYHRQVEINHEAFTGTHELMNNGKANYLEVLTAQESLLSAQLNEATNIYNEAQAVIALYIALGGGTK